ncbi:MAG: hypothetical protein DRN30_06910, partial [Thermoplasmata archaeon]
MLDPGNTYSSYLWQDNSPNQLYLVTQSGTYWVAVTNSDGCSTSDTIVVNQTPPFSIDLGNDSIYCHIPSVTLDAGNTYSSYLWQDGSTNSNLTVFNNSTNWVHVTDVNGCTGGDTIVVSFFRDTVDLGNDTTVCSGNPLTLDAGSGFINYLWNTGQTTQTIAASTTGEYSVEASFAHCMSYDTADVTIQQSAFSYAGSNESICQFQTFDFSNCNILPSPNNYDSLLWFGGLGSFNDTRIPRPEYTPLNTELGDVVLSLIAYSSPPCPNDTSSMVLTVSVLPDAGFDILPQSTTCVGSQLSFVDTSSTTIVSWLWDFGDGSPVGTAQNVTHAYSASGSYTVTLIIVNSNSCSDTISSVVLVNGLPTANYTYSPNSSICVDEVISFVDNSSSSVVSWEWNFDDGNTSMSQNPIHAFVANGNYNVQLVVRDNNTCENSATSSIQIHPLPEPDFTIHPNDTVCAELPITFNGFDIAGTSITEWNWDFGDGNTSTLQNPEHTYNIPDDYTISLNLLNNNSCTETQFKQVHIQTLPESNFTISPNDTSCMGELIYFDATNITNDIELWNWEFGDGNTGVGQNVSHTFSDPNSQTYNILSIYQNSNGCIDTTINTRVVENVTIDFDITENPSCEDYTVLFTGTSGMVTFTDWNWDFGDGSVPGLGHNESHIYTQPETVDVILNVCSEQEIKQLVINPTCIADAGPDDVSCEDVPYTLAAFADNYTNLSWTHTGLGTLTDETTLTPIYTPALGENNVVVDITLVATGIGSCSPQQSTMHLQINEGSYANAGSDEFACAELPFDFANSTTPPFQYNSVATLWTVSSDPTGGSFEGTTNTDTVPVYNIGSNPVTYPVTLTFTMNVVT